MNDSSNKYGSSWAAQHQIVCQMLNNVYGSQTCVGRYALYDVLTRGYEHAIWWKPLQCELP